MLCQGDFRAFISAMVALNRDVELMLNSYIALSKHFANEFLWYFQDIWNQKFTGFVMRKQNFQIRHSVLHKNYFKSVFVTSYFLSDKWLFSEVSFLPISVFQFFTLYLLLLSCSSPFSPKDWIHFPSKAAVMYLLIVTIQSHWSNSELQAVHLSC